MLNFFISAFLADLALGAVLLSLPLLLIYKFGAGSLTLGLFGALGSLIYSLGVIAAGRLSDRFDRKNIILSGCVLFLAVYLILPFLKELRYVFLIYVFGAISMSLFWPIIQSWLSQGLNKTNLISSLKNFNVCWSAGLAIGFLTAGFLFLFNNKYPFFFGAALIAVVIVVIMRQPVISEIMDGPVKKAFLETKKDRPKSAEKFLLIAWCANFVSWYVVGLVRHLFPKLGSELGYSSSEIGFFAFLMFLAQTVMFLLLGRTHKWHYRLFPLIALQVLSIAALLTLAFNSKTVYFIPAMLCLGLSIGMTYFSSIFYSLYGFIDKGKKSGIHESFIGLGGLFGPLVGGIAAHTFGVRAPYVTAAVLLAVAIIVESILYRKSDR